MTRPTPVILASGSFIREEILSGAGVAFEARRPDVDEDLIKREAVKTGKTLEATAALLADAKALAVTDTPGALVIGADQILEFKGVLYDKPGSMEDVRLRLMEMSGHSHTLINAVSVARNNDIIWRHLDRPRLDMRTLSEAEIDGYIAAAGPGILSSVGAYQIEKLGARLFDRIDGDHYAVLGLSLFPLLNLLRREGALAF